MSKATPTLRIPAAPRSSLLAQWLTKRDLVLDQKTKVFRHRATTGSATAPPGRAIFLAPLRRKRYRRFDRTRLTSQMFLNAQGG